MEGYLDGLADETARRRATFWTRDFSSPERYEASVAANRERLRRIIGAVDARVPPAPPELVATLDTPSLVAESPAFTAHQVRWAVCDDVTAEGLLLQPKGRVIACVVALPDADQTPEAIAGLVPGLPESAQFARRLAEHGCLVLVPTLISRADTFSGSATLNRYTNQPHREWIYRQAYTFGRHVIGYEVVTVRAAIDWFAQRAEREPAPVAVAGWGEGGLLALHVAALDPRIEVALVSGYFAPREQLWDEPIYRNCFGLLREFGDAEIASLIAPRVLMVDPSDAPAVDGPPKGRPGARISAARGRIVTPSHANVRAELERAQKLAGPLGRALHLLPDRPPAGPGIGDAAVLQLLQALSPSVKALSPPAPLRIESRASRASDERQKRIVGQWEEHTQRLIAVSRDTRDAGLPKAERAETWHAAMQPQRDALWQDVMGRLPRPGAPSNVRTRRFSDGAKWTGYEVMMDVLPGVPLWGYLLLPKGMVPGERRPVVVAQHGLNGLPANVINEDPAARTNRVYRAFAAQLADRGYVVFVPHFPWRVQDDYRRLQRKANPLGVSVFSFVLAHHGALLDWLTQQSFVDAKRIALYGLSWGGKVALRVPALEPRYALGIASGDFNEWIWKTSTTAWGGSYLYAPEPDMFEFNLGMVAGHATMAAMIAPRPFMVERGHTDGVGTDEWVAFEYAKVRRLYDALRSGDRTEIEFFNGGHEIHAVGTFHFLERHFNWPAAR